MDYSEEKNNKHNVLELYTVSNEYCLFTENVLNYRIEDVLAFYGKILPLLYLKGLLLPDLKPEDDYFGEKFVTEQDWENAFNALRNTLGKQDLYHKLEENNIVKASISEDLSDIFQDMKDFVWLYQKGMEHARKFAVIECKNTFASGWGQKILSALTAIHHIQYPNMQEDIYNADY